VDEIDPSPGKRGEQNIESKIEIEMKNEKKKKRREREREEERDEIWRKKNVKI